LAKNNVIKSEQVVPCDIDDTLIVHGKIKKSHKCVAVTNPHTGEQKYFRVNKANVAVLKQRIARGATVLAWSAGGHAWAESVLKALKIAHHNVYVLSKPVAYIDDTDCSLWMGPRVWLSPDSEYST
jgi:hypothetical protein